MIGRFAVGRDIQPFDFLALRHAQADQQIDQLVGDKRNHARPDQRGEHRLQLEKRRRGKYAGQQRARRLHTSEARDMRQ